MLLAITLVAVHVRRSVRPRAEFMLVASIALIGWIWESALVYLGLLAYPGAALLHGTAPFWLVALWALFAAQFNTSYRWLKRRIKTAAVLGAVAGPVSFHAGKVLGAVHFLKLWPATAALATGWAVLLPIAVLLSRRWDGVE